MTAAKYRLSVHKPGTAPGTLTVQADSPPPVMQAICYGPDRFDQKTNISADDVPALLAEWPIVWINVDGLGSKEVVEQLGKIFSLHPLALEDVLNPFQRPKTEDYGEITFIVIRMTRLEKMKLVIEKLSLFLGKGFVLTFQDRPGDCFDPIRDRIRRGEGGRLRTSGSDYLAYALVDAVIDSYFPVLEKYGEWIDGLEDDVIGQPAQKTVEHIHQIRRKLGRLRQASWPMRDAISNFARMPIVSDQTRLYIRDCHDHLIQVIDLIETDRERAAGLIDIYLSGVSNRMNEIMKVLTIIATIFIPLSFIASVYGMNFDTKSPWNMPELEWRYGYAFALSLMAAVAGALIYYFWRKGWLSGTRR